MLNKVTKVTYSYDDSASNNLGDQATSIAIRNANEKVILPHYNKTTEEARAARKLPFQRLYGMIRLLLFFA